MQWAIFGGVWALLVVGCFVVAGAFGEAARNRVRASSEPLDPRSTHHIHIENSTQLFLITVLLAGILAALVALLLR